MKSVLDDILSPRGAPALCLGAAQRRRLEQLIGGGRDAVLWNGVDAITTRAAIFVLETSNATRIETLIGSLHADSVVIVPCSENPAFDALKTRLLPYGSIGTCGASAPHHLWWGGANPLALPTGMYRKQDTLYISSFEKSSPDAKFAELLQGDLKRFGLENVLQPMAAQSATGSAKIDFIIAQLEVACRPVVWIDPRARVQGLPFLPQSIGCDFAVHRRPSGELDTGVLFFHQTEASRSLLEIWQRLTRSHPTLPESFLLDQAWTLAASQRQLETAWLPDDYWQTSDLKASNKTTVIAAHAAFDERTPLDSAAAKLNGGRRFGRHQAPEAHLIMKADAEGRGAITVMIRDVLAASARDVGEAVEATARAFAADCGGFSQLEVVLCAWDDDADSVMQIDDQSWVLITDPSERLEAHSFKSLGRPDAAQARRQIDQIRSVARSRNPKSVLKLVDPSLGARLKRSGRYPGSFLQRPVYV
jgi:hypothetical protein